MDDFRTEIEVKISKTFISVLKEINEFMLDPLIKVTGVSGWSPIPFHQVSHFNLDLRRNLNHKWWISPNVDDLNKEEVKSEVGVKFLGVNQEDPRDLADQARSETNQALTFDYID